MDRKELKNRVKDSITIYDILPSDIDRKAKVIRCPLQGHQDQNPSFSTYANGTRARCHSQCGDFDIFSLYQKIHGVGFNDALKNLAQMAGIPYPENGNGSKGGTAKKIEATYDYKDLNGKLIFQAVRYSPKSFSQRRPDGKGGWIWNLKGIATVPYNLPEVLKAETVFIPEGEKDCDNLKELGLTATTCPMGAGKWKQEYSPYFKGKNVVILSDNDKHLKENKGQEHGEHVANSLRNIANAVKVLSLPNLPDNGGDITDWIKVKKSEGKNLSAVKAELLALVDKAPEWKPFQEGSTDKKESKVRAVSIAEFLAMTFPPRENILSPWLPMQGICMVHASRGIGKTFFGLNTAIAVASGGQFLRFQAPKPRGVLYLDGEMPAVVMQERIAKTIASVEKEPTAPIKIVTPDLQKNGSPNLASMEGQLSIEPFLDGISLVVVDNLSTLCRVGRENEGES